MADPQEHDAHDAPEVVFASFPEAVPQNSYRQYPPGPFVSFKPEDSADRTYVLGNMPYSTGGGSHVGYASSSSSPFYPRPVAGPSPGSGHGGGRKRGMICGCTILVFVLCLIIALLAAAVIGLAVGTGVEAHRANTAQAKADQLNTSLATVTVTATPSTPTSTSFAELDDNCSGNPQGVTGTTYSAFSVIGDFSFTIQCNKDALGDPLMGLFASDFNDCMNACASYSRFTPSSFGNNTNTTCGAVSFIPAWTNKTVALNAGSGAPGNCYLKPTQTGQPNIPSGGTEVHAGVLKFT